MGIIDRKLLWLALSGTGAANLSGADALLDGEAQGLAFDFTDQSVRIIDTSTPSNSTRSTGIVNQGSLVGPSGKLTYTSASNKLTLQSDGVMRYQAHNLAGYSNNFEGNGANGSTNATVSGNVVSISGANAFLYRTLSSAMVSGAPYQIDCDVTCSTTAVVGLRVATGTERAELAVSCTAGVTQSVTLTFTMDATGIQFGVEQRPTITAGVSDLTGETVTIENIHLRRTPSNDDYIETAGAAKYALPIEYDTSGNCLGLLVEEQRTNVIPYSTTTAQWAALNLTASANSTDVVDIFGLNGATKLTGSGGSAAHLYYPLATPSLSAATNYVCSIYVKAGTLQYIQLLLDGTPFGNEYANFDIQNGTATGSASGTLVDYGIENAGNGWYRLWIVDTSGSTAASPIMYIAPLLVGNETYNPTLDVDGLTFYVMQADCQAGSFPTSPIITYGAAATRAADQPSQLTSTFPLSATAGSFYAYVAPYAGADLAGIVSLNDGSGDEEIVIYKDASANIVAQVEDGGVNQLAPLDSTVNASSGTAFKVALAWAANDFALSADGTAAQTDTGGTLPTVTTLEIGVDQANNYFNGHIKAISYVPRRKSDAELQTETA